MTLQSEFPRQFLWFWRWGQNIGKLADCAPYSKVSSNCALLFPSTVVAVQLSGQWTSAQLVPRFSICPTLWVSFQWRGRKIPTGSMVKHWGEKGQIAILIVVLHHANHSRFHCSDCFVFSVMWYIWGTMEKIVDPMACVCTNNRTSIRSCDWFAYGKNICKLPMETVVTKSLT